MFSCLTEELTRCTLFYTSWINIFLLGQFFSISKSRKSETSLGLVKFDLSKMPLMLLYRFVHIYNIADIRRYLFHYFVGSYKNCQLRIQKMWKYWTRFVKKLPVLSLKLAHLLSSCQITQCLTNCFLPYSFFPQCSWQGGKGAGLTD